MINGTPRRRLRPEQRRELILDSALRGFAAHGYHAASVSEIARGAGTTKAVVYDHFATKRDLYDAVVQRELEQLLVHVAATEVPDGSARDRLRTIFDSWFAYVASRPDARRLMFETADSEPGDAGRRRENQARATDAIAAWLAGEGELFAGHPERELQLQMAAQMLKSTLNGLADWWFDRPEVAGDRVVDAATDFVLGGLERMQEG